MGYRHPLIIGTGGGNDIVSACLLVADLALAGIEADVAGLCSPGASHTYDEEPEGPINKVTAHARRFIGKRELTFIDAHIPTLLGVEGLRANVYNLSGCFGTDALITGLEYLIRAQGYDGIIAVDVGGDILARGPRDPTILSPLMDFTTLYAVAHLSVPATLVEFGLQTDGELRPAGCAEILDELTKKGIMTSVRDLQYTDRAVQTFARMYHAIEPIRHGHTAAMTIRTLQETEDIHTDYRFRIQVQDRKWYHTFPLLLEKRYFGKAFVMDARQLAGERHLAFPYQMPLGQYLRMKQLVDTKAEMDMTYTSVNGEPVWLGLLCPQMQGPAREEILRYGLCTCTTALLWERDAALLAIDGVRCSPFLVSGAHVDTVALYVSSLLRNPCKS
ncbi:DUF1152 domain-containing protein [Candidatus Woesearchaeota archaeon]|nr:DUF1152 domain-containing protein [Candidatus Woesearchaeota archaeon]